MELDQTNYCDDVDERDASGNIIRPTSPDPHQDPCKAKIEVRAGAVSWQTGEAECFSVAFRRTLQTLRSPLQVSESS